MKRWGDEEESDRQLYRIKPKHSEAEGFSFRKTKIGGVLIELGLTATDKGTFCEVMGLLGEKASVSSLETTSSLEIPDLNCLTEKKKVEEAIKHECPHVANAQIRISSANSWKLRRNIRRGFLTAGSQLVVRYVGFEFEPPQPNVIDI